MNDSAVAELGDREAVRVLALVAGRPGPVPDTAALQELADRLREAAADPDLDPYLDLGRSPDRPAVTGGELARTALAHLAATPAGADIVRRAISIAKNDTSRFVEPATLAIGALAVLALQTEVELTRTTTGRWRLRVHKQAMRDSTLGTLLGRLVDLFRPTG